MIATVLFYLALTSLSFTSAVTSKEIFDALRLRDDCFAAAKASMDAALDQLEEELLNQPDFRWSLQDHFTTLKQNFGNVPVTEANKHYVWDVLNQHPDTDAAAQRAIDTAVENICESRFLPVS